MKQLFLGLMGLGLVACTDTKNFQDKVISGVSIEDMDTTATPQNDFYKYACGGWMSRNPLDAEHSRFGTFDKLHEENRETIKALIDSILKANNKQGSIADKIATFYKVGMDSARLQEQGATPIKPMLEEINKIKTKDEFISTLTKLHKNGISPFFGLFNEADPDNSDMQIAWIWQGALGMGNRDYYLEAKNEELRAKYVEMIEKEVSLAGYDSISGLEKNFIAKEILRIETLLAKAQYSKTDNQDPAKTLHKMTLDNADSLNSAINLKEYFSEMGVKNATLLNIGQPEYLEAMNKLISSENLALLKSYLAWHVITDNAPYMSDDFVNAEFDFYGKAMSGKEKQQARWKRVTEVVNGTLSEGIGQLYVEKYFPPHAKKRMLTIISNLRNALCQRINNATWMQQETKSKALEKLDAINVKVGYPDQWKDYSTLEIKDDSYVANIMRSRAFEVARSIEKMYKPTDKNEWFMSPQTINAYYNPAANEIVFPAGILQPPFFNVNADDASNYGAIGVVIGHEITHGFDNNGRKFDKKGNLTDWWTQADAEKFEQRAQVLVNWFDSIQVLSNPVTFGNGKLTLGENIADNGGLHISYLAMQEAIKKGEVKNEEMDGFSAAQRFFLAYARVWACNITDKEILRRTTIDPHSLAKWRVNGTLPHIQEFISAWNVTSKDSLFLAPEAQAKLW